MLWVFCSVYMYMYIIVVFTFVGTTTNRKSIIHFKMGELINSDIELAINENKLIY